LTYPSEKYELVSWDDEIPNIWKNKIIIKLMFQKLMFQTTNQSFNFTYIINYGKRMNMARVAQSAYDNMG
jgi:phosphosulfolactate synthase (CoM biosynthesis protein A)